MSMILFAYVARVTDGLPLSASTDFECSRELQECKKQLKVVSKMLGQFPGRGTVKSNQLHIHFTSSQGIAYMTICCSYYPTTMAFCFLEELGMEFISSFEIAKIHMVSRPYAFLEFAPSYRLEPVSAVGILSVILNIMCGALNLIRGVHLIEHNFQDGDEEKGSVIAFLIAFITCVFQCYLYLFFVSTRMIKAAGAFILICICNFYLFGLRNVWQILFHLGVAFLSLHQILSRKLTEKQPDCGV
ncbi:vesicle-trafficking protein SEC22c isoform X5 [Chiloscyllium punctatum]|uniref:vesicle-trafficking protein SEC22c isoform X5 n=1 Tax=Chiloscyllium punctatum TaxID=137246 RepID=UPI003B64063F